MSKPNDALLAKLSKLSPAQREALLKKLQQKKPKKTPTLQDQPIICVNRTEQDFALSYAQQRLWFLEQLDPGNAAYNIAAALRLQGNLKPDILNQTFKRIISRHESLRTVFINGTEGARQKVLDKIDWELEVSELPSQQPSMLLSPLEDSETIIHGEANLGFNLEKGPLFRAKLLKISDDEYILTVVMHHIISDAWSSQILLAEVSRFYNALCQGTAVAIPVPKVQYVDYSLWQRQYLEQNVGEQQLQYWQQQLEGCSNLQLAGDNPRPTILTYNGSFERIQINAYDVKQLQLLCQQQGCTLYVGLMALFQSLLFRHTQQQDFCIGTPVAGRNHAELEPLIGFFVNSLAIRNDANGDDSFANLLHKVKKTTLTAQSHQDIPFEQLVDKISPERDGSYSPIFQVFFSYNPGDANSQLQLNDVKSEFISADTDTAKFDLSLIISDKVNTESNESGTNLCCHFEYNTDLFCAASIQRIAQQFKQLLKHAYQMPDAPLHSLNILDSQQQQQLQDMSTTTYTQTPAATDDIASLFEQQTLTTPNKNAIVQGHKQLSYQQLNQQANQLAQHLLTQGLKSGDFVGLCFPPSCELMIALLACVKVGACYVPMDPGYPADRLSYMAEHAQLKLLLSAQRIDTSAINIAQKINIDQIDTRHHDTSNPVRDINKKQPLYVIYTSGSTGVPKAAMVSHANEINLINWYAQEYALQEHDHFLVFSAIGFDLTQKNLLTPLCYGAELHFSELEWYEPEAIIKTIQQQKITWVNCAPSAFYPLIDSCTDFSQLKTLEKIFFGGENIQLSNLNNWLHSPHFNAQITNMYGPTECTDIAAVYTLDDAKTFKGLIPIGQASANVQLHILDEYLTPLPQGAIGELFIGGAGVGLGYLHNPAQTADSYIQNPFSTTQDDNDKLYRSGDLVRLREDGNVQFIARCDDQIKIRGFRIELGEIEAQIRHIHGVDDAVVTTRDINGQAQLLAFIVTDQPLQEQHFYKQVLHQHLPDYMVPIAYYAIDTIPLSANAKIARDKLPAIDLSQLKQAEYIAPRNINEAELSIIWQNLLGIKDIGVRDNFFELGGHSLLATQMLTRIRDGFDVELPLRTIFEVSTIEGLSEIISAMKPTIEDFDIDDDEAFEEGVL